MADACRGLLSVTPDGHTEELTNTADGVPIGFADDVEVAAAGQYNIGLERSLRSGPRLTAQSIGGQACR